MLIATVLYIKKKEKCVSIVVYFEDNNVSKFQLHRIIHSIGSLEYLIWKMTKRKVRQKSGYKFTVLKFFEMWYKEW